VRTLSCMLRRLTIGISLAALAAGVFLAVASAGSSPPVTSPAVRVPVAFERNHHRPVAGRGFTGLVIADSSSVPDGFSASCGDATVGNLLLKAQRESFLGGGQTNVVVCDWQIPKDSGGKQFKVWGAYARTASFAGGLPASASWRVRRYRHR
jgi:hypothetical protein